LTTKGAAYARWLVVKEEMLKASAEREEAAKEARRLKRRGK
jgi:hypothetical protein